MLPLLELREKIKNFYKQYDAYLVPAIKFIFAFIAFQAINKEIGYDVRFKSIPIVFALSLLSAFTPSAIMVLLAAAIAILHVFFISPILSIIVIMVLMILYLIFLRYTPNQGYVVLAVPVLFLLKMPYFIPILLGLISTPVAMVPTSCGVIVYFLFQVIKTAVTTQTGISVEDIMQLYTTVVDNLIGNKQMIMTIAIFALIIMVTYSIRKMSFDYAFEISILAGGLTSILGFLISYLILNKSGQILGMIVGTIISTGLVFIVHFFELTLDYSRAEHARFEDEVYYYYVKAVPKVTVTVSQVNVKHINSSDVKSREFSEPDTDETEEYFNYDDDDYTNF